MAKLTSAARNNLSESEFVYPKERRYPIPDLSHARNALARSSGKPEEGKVRAAVYKKFPALKKHADEHPYKHGDCEMCRDASDEYSEWGEGEEGSPQYPDSDMGAEIENESKRAGLNVPGAGSRKDGVVRYDRGELAKPERLPNGWLRAEGVIGRTGLLKYEQADGSEWTEYRPPEAHNDAMLKTFALVPLTDTHPAAGLLDAENTKMFQVGTVEAPHKDGALLRSNILVTDADAIAHMERGRVQLSCGYLCDLDMTPGEVDGQHYDAVQTDVRGNHVALVDIARAGDGARVRMDSKFNTVVPSKTVEVIMVKVRIDGLEYDASEQLAAALAKENAERADAVKRAAATKAELEKQTARADALEKSLAEAPAKVRAEIAGRTELENKARKVLGNDVKFDGKSDLEIRTAVVEKSLGARLDGKSPEYIAAAFDLAVDRKDADKGALDGAPVTSRLDGGSSGPVSDTEKTMKDFYEASRNAYKAGLSGQKK